MNSIKLTENAMIKRINRRLKQDDECLRTSRKNGEHYVHNVRGNYVTFRDVNVEAFARELGVI